MEEIKRRFIDSVAAKLSAAPQSDTKDELIEELSDNLYRRFLDMTGAGVSDEDAFTRSMEDLGDVDELLAYLGVEPETDLKITVAPDGSQTEIETRDGQRVIINTGDDSPITINGEDGEPVVVNVNGGKAQPQDGQDAEATQEEAGAARKDAQPGPKNCRTDEKGDIHYDYSGGFSQSDLDAILAGVSEACNTAIDQAKAAIKQAKDAMKRRTTVQRDNGHMKVHFNTHPDGSEPAEPVPPVEPVAPVPPVGPDSGKGWEFEAELDSDNGRFFAGAGPKEKKDVVYGFGYDKAKGGFFTQWGEWKGEYQDVSGPRFSGKDSGVRPNEDGSYSVTALKDLRGIVVQTVAGDVTIRDTEAPDAGVIIDGDVDDLDVTCSADGILTIREGRTASSSFFSRRGIGSADVELSLPRRRWELLDITTASGDVELDICRLDLDQLRVKTASGDLNAGLHSCGELRFHSASGDLELDLKDGCADLHAETMSGDVCVHGEVGDALVKTASGDIESDGLAVRFLGSTMSGDIRVETSQLPQVMELSSKSGDVEARIPDAGPFTLRMKTVSGEMDCQFRVNYINGMLVYGDGSGPSYSMTTVSGDVSLERY